MPDFDEIMIVEDERATLEMLCLILKERGYKPRPTTSGALALRSIEAKPPALVILDVRMPEMDGYEVCRRLKENEKTREIPVIFISGVSEGKDRVKGLKMGAVDYIIKPFYQEEVLARVGNCLAARRAEQEVNQLNATLELAVAERTADLNLANRELNRKVAELEHAHKELQETSLRYRIVTDNTYDWEYWRDPAGEVLYVSPSCELITGYSQEEITRDPEITQRIVVPEDAEVYLQHRVSAYEKHEVCSREFRITHRDGSIRWIGHVCRPVYGDDGAFIGVRGCNRDITSQKQASLQLEESEARYRSLFENMTQGVFYQHADGSMEDVNDTALRMLGVTRDQFLGRTSYDPRWKAFTPGGEVLPPDKHGSMVALRTGKRVEDMEIGVYNPKSGKTVWIIVNAIPEFRPGEGKPYRVVVTLQDITSRRKAEESKRESEDRFRQFFSTLPEAAYLVSADLVILEVNEGAKKLLGYSREELVGRKITTLPVQDGRKFSENIGNRLMENGLIKGMEIELVCKDGTKRTVLVYAAALKNEQGSLIGYTSVDVDITQRKLAEDALRASETRFSTIFNNSPVGIALSTLPEGRIIDFNPAMLTLLEYTREEVIGSTVYELDIWVDPGIRAMIVKQLAEKRGGLGIEAQVRAKSGRIIDATIFLEIIEIEGKTVLLSMLQDITRRKAVERELQQAMEGLKKSEAGLAEAQLLSHLGSWDWDLVTNQVTWTDEMYRIFGFEPGKFDHNPESLIGVIHPDDRDIYIKTMEDNLLRGVESPLEYRVIHPDGSIHAVYAFGKIFTDRSGKPVRNRGYVQDITERKQAEDELRASEQRFSTIISSSPIGIYISSLPEGTFLNTNPALLDLLGYERDEVIGNTPEKLGLWADSETSAAMYDLNKHRRSAHSLEAMLKTKSGKAVSVLISTELIQVDGQRVMLGMLQDITSRKEAENALRASETRLATIFKNSPIGISVTDIESGMMFEASPAMLVMLGYSREEALGHTTVELGIWPDLSERERFKAELKQGGKARNFQTTLRNKSGNLINVRIEAEMVEIDGKSVMLSVMEDITSRKSMEKALLESEKLVGIGTLAAGIAHEINTPLQVVCGISETLLRKIKNSEAMAQEDHLRRLEMVNNNAWRIAAIVRALMEYARISTGQVKLCTINEIVASALKLIEHQFKGGTNIRINLNLEDGMPEVSCDAGKITQVLINLLNNARDAMPAGGKITISTSCNQETGEIYLRVEDSGTGVPDEIRGRIFDPFFTTCEPGHGMGLGLPVAAGIMRAHHGRLDLERSSEHGSVFLAVLPLSAGDVEEVNITSAGRYKNTPEG